MDKKEKVVKTKKEKGTPFYKKPGFKYSWLSTALIAIFIACIVGVNILASYVDSRMSFNIDLTSTKDYSISDENAGFIKSLDKEVNIIMTATEEDYKNNYASWLAEGGSFADSTGGKYFIQTVELLKNYAKLNSKINLKFIDAQTPAFEKYAEKYQNAQIYVGDILIECSFKNSEGKQQNRYKILSIGDLYTLDNSSYTSVITGSNVESALTSALMFVSAEQTDNVTVITGYGSSNVEALTSLLGHNNYVVDELENLTTSDIPEYTDVLVLAAPERDMTPEEIKKIDEFLLGGKLNKNFVYFAASPQVALPNLEGALKEWGIAFDVGTVYETDPSYHHPMSNSAMFLVDAESDYTKNINKGLRYFSDSLRPMTTTFADYDRFHTTEIVKTYSSAVVMPKGAEDDWAPEENAKKQAYSSIVMSTYATGDDDGKTSLTSNVLAVSSVNFVDEMYLSAAYYANDDLMVELFNKMVKRDDGVYKFTNKVIDVAVFTPTQSQSNVITYACGWGIPIALLVASVVVFARRKSR